MAPDGLRIRSHPNDGELKAVWGRCKEGLREDSKSLFADLKVRKRRKKGRRGNPIFVFFVNFVEGDR